MPAFNLIDKNIDINKKSIEGHIPYIKSQAKINGRIDEDLFQHLLTVAIEEIDKNYNDNYALSTFLHQLIPSRRYNYLKDRNKNVVSLNDKNESGQENIQLVQSNTRTEEEYITKEDQKIIMESLNKLDDKYQRTLMLRFSEKMTLREIGDKLGCSYEGVRKRINVALRDLKKMFRWKGLDISDFKETIKKI